MTYVVEKERQSIARVYTKEDFNTVTRFEGMYRIDVRNTIRKRNRIDVRNTIRKRSRVS